MSSNDQEQTVVGNAAAMPPASTGFSVLSEHEKQLRDDYEWCLRDAEVRRHHGGQVVAAHRRRIWGAGPNHSAALRAALQEPACPSRELLTLVAVPEEDVRSAHETEK